MFTEPITAVETPRLTPADQLALCEEAYQLAEREFREACLNVQNYAVTHKPAHPLMEMGGKIFVRVNALKSEGPELRRLAGIRQQAFAVRNRLLKERAELRKALGLLR